MHQPRFSAQPFPIPVVAAGEPDDEGLDVLPMPREMSTFEMPRLPEPGADSDVAGAHAVLSLFLAHLGAWVDAGMAGPPPALDLALLPAPTLRVINESLGQGEVSALLQAGHEVRVQETVFCGVWREQHLQGSHLLHDHLMAARIPPLVATQARATGTGVLRPLPLPTGAMNVPALLNELQEAMDRCGPHTPPHVLNLTLLPLSPEDKVHLDAVLEGGSVVLLSRGFGSCRIASTAARHVWRVQFFNSMNTLLLDTIEVVAMPEAALAAEEDIAETRGRLAELVHWLGDSLGEPLPERQPALLPDGICRSA